MTTTVSFDKIFIIGEKLGSGTFGDVFKVTSRDTGREYAMKREDRISEDSKPQRREEVKALRKCEHQNIVKYYSSFIDGNVIRIVMEFCPGGDLAKQIDIQRKLRKNIIHAVLLEWIFDLASGLDYLRQKKILHRDLKPANIFISDKENKRRRLKIGDFGLARCMNRSSEMGTSKLGTPSYTAPEVLLGHDYCHEADLFSFGCVLYEMTTLKRAFPGQNPFLVYEKIKALQYDMEILESNKEHKYFCTQLVPKFLLKEPKHRMTAKDVLDLKQAFRSIPGFFGFGTRTPGQVPPSGDMVPEAQSQPERVLNKSSEINGAWQIGATGSNEHGRQDGGLSEVLLNNGASGQRQREESRKRFAKDTEWESKRKRMFAWIGHTPEPVDIEYEDCQVCGEVLDDYDNSGTLTCRLCDGMTHLDDNDE